MKFLWKALSPALLAVLLLTASGCGKSTGSLSGTVKYNNELLEVGQVVAVNDQGQPVGRVDIVTGGKYTLLDLPPGPVTVLVMTYGPDGSPLGAAAAPGHISYPPNMSPEQLKEFESKVLPPSVVKARELLKPIPLKYSDAKQSDLKTTVVEGTVTSFDIELTGEGQIPTRLVAPPSTTAGGPKGPPPGPKGPPPGPKGPPPGPKGPPRQ